MRRRPRGGAWTATLAGLAALAVTAVAAASWVLAAFVPTYLAGLVLGFGLVATAWTAWAAQRRAQRKPRAPGRSKTLDCRQARWSSPPPLFDHPRPPTAAQRRVRPCRGSRHA